MRWSFLLLGACGRVGFATHDAGDASDTAVDASPYCAQAISVATGRDHSCLVDEAGAVWCWGLNIAGQVDPALLTEHVLEPVHVSLPMAAMDVVAGRDYSCAHFADGSVMCWGNNTAGQIGDTATFGLPRVGPSLVPGVSATDVKAGAQTVCVRRTADQGVVCWGDSQYGEGGGGAASATPRFILGTGSSKQLAVGHRHACIISPNDDVACWGSNVDYRLGDTGGNRSAPIVAMFAAKSRHVAAGGRTTCSVTLAGNFECWGLNDTGQLGTGDVVTHRTEMPAQTSLTAVASSDIGTAGACAQRTDGTLACWGNLESGDGTYAHEDVPHMSALTNVTALSTSFYHACAIADGRAVCWGGNVDGELGRGARSISAVPMPVDLGGRSVSHVTVGRGHVCVIASGELLCWGDNNGRFGNGSRDGSRTPVTVASTGLSAPIVGVVGGGATTCVWSASEIRCSGDNYYAGVGDGSTTNLLLSSQPISVIGTPVQDVVLGQDSGCELAGGAVSCWGRNLNGEVGDGTTMERRAPVSTGLTNVAAIALRLTHACARLTGGGLYCWGNNDSGQIGNGTQSDQLTPTLVDVAGQLVSTVATGFDHTCATTMGGALYCWGRNDAGELGLGDTSMRTIPTVVIASGVASVAAGNRTTCARMTGGDVRCWGYGYNGERADGAAGSLVSSPTVSPALAGVDQVFLNAPGGCARRGGALECWGESRILGNDAAGDGRPDQPHIACP